MSIHFSVTHSCATSLNIIFYHISDGLPSIAVLPAISMRIIMRMSICHEQSHNNAHSGLLRCCRMPAWHSINPEIPVQVSPGIRQAVWAGLTVPKTTLSHFLPESGFDAPKILRQLKSSQHSIPFTFPGVCFQEMTGQFKHIADFKHFSVKSRLLSCQSHRKEQFS